MAAKKPASTELQTKAASVFVISEELRNITAKIIDQGGEIVEGDLEALQMWTAALENKAEGIAHVAEVLKKDIEYYKAVEEAANARRKARESTVEKLRKFLLFAMTSANIEKIKKEDGLFTISVCKGKASAHVSDPGRLPMELTDIVETIKPKLNEIKALLEAGKEVPGAALEYGSDYITIR